MPAKLKSATLGCKVNQYETQYVCEGLHSIGYEDAEPEQSADLCIINTCTVTNEGDSKSRQVIRRMARDNPDARIVVMGCYATRAPDEVAVLPGVEEVVTDKRELPDLLGRFGVVDLPTGISRFGNRHRAYVKVQDGCLLRCSYCIIPQVRPVMTSRPMDEILDEVRRLVTNGYREIVLTGVHLGHYGVEGNWQKPKSEWTRLSNLVQEIVKLDGKFRVRLSSIEVTEVTRDLLHMMADHADRICPHLHICLQSGSDSVLRRMKRRWGTRRFIDRCSMTRDYLDQPALTTDVIVGFPGESDDEFEQTCDVVRQVGFAKVHVFPFSPRRGTPAAEMSDPVIKSVKAERRRQLEQLEMESRAAYMKGLLGGRLTVLVQSSSDPAPGQVVGTSCRYMPVQFAGQESCEGRLVNVFAREYSEDRILADSCAPVPKNG